MNTSENDARRSLQEIEDVADRTRRMAAFAGTDVILVIWGMIWMLGYLGNEIIPRLALSLNPKLGPAIQWLIPGWWSLLIIAGIAATMLVSRRNTPVESSIGKRIGWLWLALFGYVYLLGFLLMPFVKLQGFEEEMRFFKHMGALAAIVPMLGYVVIGLWLDSFLVWVGLGVTALTVLGLYLLTPWFWTYMAFVGGGALIGTGLVIRRKWRAL